VHRNIQRLRKNVSNRPSTFFNEMKGAAVGDEIHLFIIQPDLAQNRRLQIADVMRLVDRLISYFIRCAFHNAALHAAARK
jgi:hypothetical protein